MFNQDETNAIRRVAARLDEERPSKSLLGVITDKATEPNSTYYDLCLEIDIRAKEGKLASEDNPQENQERAKMFRELLEMFMGDSIDDQKKRAAALRYVNKLRGFPYREPPKQGGTT
ncbi:hypothetical protein FJZ31_32795 [Candidatus Poribacteria bacterium]|nr:hypothetical protein [Candidatus Poribacteria bacterium]